ncbi:putative Translocator protein [Hypsibius exemplaris]|uniref:Translocator protein n=1 Tax=Hypsibius exemplaris TaxID=2072580 RepID=A0A9X6NNP0_HYPEX|nr:putative Translocator protein [Hypsibius exemplaris]
MPIPPITASLLGREILPAVLLPIGGGWINGIQTRSQIESWYEKLRRPDWRPPNWVFGPVWTALYGSMGYASWLLYRSGGGLAGPARLPLILYGSQLALNFAWTPLFFKLHKTGWALADISALWLNVAACIYTFYPVNKTASYLMIPYIGWLSLASVLNWWIWKENPNADKIE